MTTPSLDALQAAEERATPGPWEPHYYRATAMADLVVIHTALLEGGSLEYWFAAQEGKPDSITAASGNGPTSVANTELVVRMRNALPWLIEQARRTAVAEAEVDRLRAECHREFAELVNRCDSALALAARRLEVLGFIGRTVTSCPTCHAARRYPLFDIPSPRGGGGPIVSGKIEHKPGCALARELEGT